MRLVLKTISSANLDNFWSNKYMGKNSKIFGNIENPEENKEKEREKEKEKEEDKEEKKKKERKERRERDRERKDRGGKDKGK
jgi:hypothetical protein